jgi:hypothetical protein
MEKIFLSATECNKGLAMLDGNTAEPLEQYRVTHQFIKQIGFRGPYI